ncbi:Gfo/Idh/MocA family oxidoreductase [bacterium]|nr:Gfo/Idh/MocA family oxidoreductase [bacterium]
MPSRLYETASTILGKGIESRPLNLAFLGCGYAATLHSKTLSRFKRDVRCFYASRDTHKAESFNRRFKGLGAFDSYETALQSDKIDVVFVTTPPALHLDQVSETLRCGKQCIVEKPPFLKSNDFDHVRELQEETGRRLFVAENYFYKPLLAKLRHIIEQGTIGEILFVHVNALKKQHMDDWRADPELSGGGALFEGGIHWINFISNLGLTVKAARGCCPPSKRSEERSILATLEFTEGAVGSLYYSWETPSLFKGLRISKIYGREGSITFESNGVMVLVRGKRKRLVFPGFSDIAGYQAMFHDFFGALREDRPPKFHLDLAERDLKVVEQIYASMN